ncbi:hypothetical protein niasHT_003372 [Heterodera trifolii]|uniref:BTB domain-containing protein n=1 Tax=Heterodera trifolii TaxID=157864 RepID=A0ABD2LP27_9BILA
MYEPSLVERMKHLLNTGEHADVYFLVGDGDEKEASLLPAHKLILRSAFEVFEAMFRFDAKNEKAEFASANCPVEVPDVEAAAFKVMLSFIYACDLSGLNGDNAMAVLYAAKKYNIPGLADQCLQIPISKLRNVFLAYAQARLFDLENFANCCLSYIDKNADTLLKSEEFLQIDKNLLCEILERDELQINGEISIWEAALRWVDVKCRQNAIESSAENLRAVLGPALYKIRFPLFAKDEISMKIVTSEVLTAEEKIGIYQFHCIPNNCAQLFYPLQFPSHGRIWTFGTISMDIEKVSEFAREPKESYRYSDDTVYIKGLPWKIMVQINQRTECTDNNEKWLGIFLWCDGTREDVNRSCKCSATVKIISQKNGEENSIGIICDRIINNKKNCLGFNNFITIVDLMDESNGFYNREEDKVTLAIDVTVKDEKTEKFISDPNKSNGTISMEIEKVSEFARKAIKSEHKSESVHIKGFSWQILAQISPKNENIYNEKWLGIYLLCAEPKEGAN